MTRPVPDEIKRDATVEYRGEQWLVETDPVGGEVRIWKKFREPRRVAVEDLELLPVPLYEPPVEVPESTESAESAGC